MYDARGRAGAHAAVMRTSLDPAATLAYHTLESSILALVIWDREARRVALGNALGRRILRAIGGTVDDSARAPRRAARRRRRRSGARRAIVDGERFVVRAMPVDAGAHLVLFTATPAPSSDDFAGRYRLTERERDIVERVCRGRSNDEIARATRLTVGTVKQYLNRIFAAVGVHNRVQLVVAAIAHGRHQSGAAAPTRA